MKPRSWIASFAWTWWSDVESDLNPDVDSGGTREASGREREGGECGVVRYAEWQACPRERT